VGYGPGFAGWLAQNSRLQRTWFAKGEYGVFALHAEGKEIRWHAFEVMLAQGFKKTLCIIRRNRFDGYSWIVAIACLLCSVRR
jgi:hypothetical protein